MGVIVKRSLSLAILVMILVNSLMHSIAAISETKSNITASCNGADNECLIIDVDLEFLMDSEINLRLLETSGGSHPTSGTAKTAKPDKAAAGCGRAAAKTVNITSSSCTGTIAECFDNELENFMDSEASRRVLQGGKHPTQNTLNPGAAAVDAKCSTRQTLCFLFTGGK
ncbi:hypothetical protein F0562_004325 [Nyssa sinensis]|uniref:Pectinesterase inhibitor domain-containing protein n=1 Tax=Nyssa sinensis TaxID=561372 RepID=A0A5J5BZ20_9ASTE|nr:hypothetical protein F0562_004325 [Nyssa sinensis]